MSNPFKRAKLGPQCDLAQLQQFRSKLPYVSHRALSAILKAAQAEPLPTITSRASVGRARDEVVKEKTPYGSLHQVINLDMLDGPPSGFEVQHPLSILYKACKDSHAMASLVRSVVASRMPSVAEPLSIILYADEISPGNQLAYKSARKVWAVYWTILEFGSAVHSDEELPVHLCVARNSR